MSLYTPPMYVSSISSTIANFKTYSFLILQFKSEQGLIENIVIRGLGGEEQEGQFSKLNDAINEIFKKEEVNDDQR